MYHLGQTERKKLNFDPRFYSILSLEKLNYAHLHGREPSA